MLVIQAKYQEGCIHIAQEGLPREAKVVVLFLDGDDVTSLGGLSPEQQAALRLQSQSAFAQNVLLNPAEDCWNDV